MRNYKQDIINDVRKAPKSQWKGVGIIWLLILYALFSGPVRASETILFGDLLQKEIGQYGVWEIPLDDSLRVLEMNSHSKLQEAIMNRMYAKYPDKDMVMTFKQECGKVSVDCVSHAKGFDGNRAYGVCQLYKTYHSNFINSPGFKDWRNQADYCVDVWKDAKMRGVLTTTFQAYPKRMQHAKYFKFYEASK